MGKSKSVAFDHAVKHSSTGSDPITGDLTANARVAVQKVGSGPFKRRKINFIEGSNVTITLADQAGSEQVDVTIAAAGGGGGTPSDTVVSETSYGQASAAGASASYARGDHTHGTPALGTTGTTACAGNDARLSDSRAPTGNAGGQLGGTYPNPDVRGLRETSGPTMLAVGGVADGQYLKRVGNTIVGAYVALSIVTSGNMAELTGASAVISTMSVLGNMAELTGQSSAITKITTSPGSVA